MSTPGSPSRRRVLIWLTIGGLVAVAAFVIWRLADAGTSAQAYDGYRFRSGAPLTWSYPTEDVLEGCIPILIQLVVVSLIVGRPRAGGGDAILVGALSVVLSVLCAPIAMHANAQVISNLTYPFLSGLWLIVIGVIHAIAAWSARAARV